MSSSPEMSKLSVHTDGPAVGAEEVTEEERLLDVKGADVGDLLDVLVRVWKSLLVDVVLVVEVVKVVEVVEVVVVSSSSSLSFSSLTFSASWAASSRSDT